MLSLSSHPYLCRFLFYSVNKCSFVSIHMFQGLRGAVAFALSTQLQFDAEHRSVLITSTLIIVLFTILVLGGSTLPLLKVRSC